MYAQWVPVLVILISISRSQGQENSGYEDSYSTYISDEDFQGSGSGSEEKCQQEEEYPRTYSLEYVGEDEFIGGVFQHTGVGGKYSIKYTPIPYNGAPYWVKHQPVLHYLYRNENGQWTVSENLALNTGILFQDSRGQKNIAPCPDLPWIIRIEKSFGSTFESSTDIVLAALDDNNDDDDVRDDDMKTLAICLSISIVVMLIVIFLVVWWIRRGQRKEDPVMEKNEVYGEDDEYYDEHNNRVEDRNDYYYSSR